MTSERETQNPLTATADCQQAIVGAVEFTYMPLLEPGPIIGQREALAVGAHRHHQLRGLTRIANVLHQQQFSFYAIDRKSVV